MPKKILKKYFPNPQSVKDSKALEFLGSKLHEPNLWHLNRRSVSRAFMIGVFFAFMPMPFQMAAAALVAIWMNANIPISVGLVWISNPITIPPIFFFTYKVGTAIMGVPARNFEIELSLEWAMSELGVIWQPLLLGSLLCGILFSAMAFVGMRIFWRWHVVHNWKKRQLIRQQISDK